MFRKSIIMAGVLAAMLSPVYAVDVTIPDAKADIAANAYENYRITNATIEKLDKTVLKNLNKGFGKKAGYSPEAIVGMAEQLRAMTNHATAVLIHDDKSHIRFTYPTTGRSADYSYDPQLQTDSYNINNGLDIMGIEVDYTPTSHTWKDTGKSYDALTNADVVNYLQRTAEEEGVPTEVNGTVFAYSTVKEATWDSMVRNINKGPSPYIPFTAETINFKLAGTDSPVYHIGYAYVGPAVINDVPLTGVVPNYLLPSVKDLRQLDNYTRTETWNGMTYRVLQDAIMSEVQDDKGVTSRIYTSGNVKQTVTVSNDNHIVEGDFDFRRPIVEYFRNADTPKQPEHMGYAGVWNNGIPGFIIDSYNPQGPSMMQFIGYDGKSALYNTISYTPSTSGYTHIQLRDMVEYFGSTNESVYKQQKHDLFPVPNSVKRQMVQGNYRR